MLIFILLLCGLSFLMGFALAAGYYAGKVREAFGIEEPSVSIIGWLNTKATKRRLDAQQHNKVQ